MYNPYNLLAPSSSEQIEHVTKGSSILDNSRREIPRDSRKKPNLGRSPTGTRETADVISHMPCRAHAVLCRALEKLLSKQHGLRTAWERHGMCELNTVALCKSYGDSTI
jgi:hypothetical protein